MSGRITAYGQHMGASLSDAQAQHDYTMRNFGMTPIQYENAMLAAGAVMRGHMPTGPLLDETCKVAADLLGFTREQSISALKDAIGRGTPDERLTAYLSAGKGWVDGNALALVREQAPIMEAAAFSQGLSQKLGESDSRAEFAHKYRAENSRVDAQSWDAKTEDRTKAHAMDMDSRHNSLLAAMGADTDKSFEASRQRVMDARSRLADRIDAGITKPVTSGDSYNMSIKDSLRDSYDIHAVNAASREYGLPDFEAAAKEIVEEQAGHFNPDYNITESL